MQIWTDLEVLNKKWQPQTKQVCYTVHFISVNVVKCGHLMPHKKHFALLDISWELFLSSRICNSDGAHGLIVKVLLKKMQMRREQESSSTVVFVFGDVDVLLEAQYLIVHCLMLASWEVVTSVFSLIQARLLMWCNLWVSAHTRIGDKIN